MKKKCLIVCWYGKIPEYFPFWEQSCSFNTDYDFIIFTDQRLKIGSKNIFVVNKTMRSMNELFSEKLGMDITIEKPYKFCDFRPAYGVIFEDYIKEYDFWGHCDLDVIFGNISNFITEDILNNYEIINMNGHFKLYANTEKINHLYELKGSKFDYKTVFMSKYNYAFDEFTGINLIAKYNHIKTILINEFADISVKHSRFLCANSKNYFYQIYVFCAGSLYKCYYDQNDQLFQQEKMYLHFQKKHPKINIDSNCENYSIGSSGLNYYSKDLSKEYITVYNRFVSNSFEKKEIVTYYFKQFLKLISSSLNEKWIWIRKRL